MRMYMILASIGLSSLYFFYQPPVSYDLYRHYEALHLLRRHDLWTVMSGGLNQYNESIESFQQGAPVYLLYAYLISLLQVDQLLAVITGIIIYTSTSGIILMAEEDIEDDIPDWKISFCFCFLLVMLDFRTISGLRYMMACALFAYVLYKDLVRNASKPFCFIAYLAIANIHNSAVILIVIRLMIELNRYIPKLVLMMIALAGFSSINLILPVLMRYAGIPMVQSLIDKLNAYGFGGGSRYIVFRAAVRFIQIVFCMLLCLYCKRHIPQTKRFQKYGDVILLFVMYAFGSIRQYDIFVRSMIFLYFAILPFVLLFLQYVVAETPFELMIPDSSMVGFSEVVLYFMIYGAMALSLYMYYSGYYRPMDPGMIYGIKRLLLN
jgi:hypothetical protein